MAASIVKWRCNACTDILWLDACLQATHLNFLFRYLAWIALVLSQSIWNSEFLNEIITCVDIGRNLYRSGSYFPSSHNINVCKFSFQCVSLIMKENVQSFWWAICVRCWNAKDVSFTWLNHLPVLIC